MYRTLLLLLALPAALPAQDTRADSLAVLERGFEGTAMVAGPIAMVWLPYDFCVNETWSHCGVDIFTMVKDDTGWKIASLAYTVPQPPACAPHPIGVPK